MLRSEAEAIKDDPEKLSTDAARRLFRAYVFVVLQKAIGFLRKFNIGESIRLLSLCEECLDSVSSARNHFHSPLRSLHYWRGRAEMARNNHAEALAHFNSSMGESEKNLTFHYSELQDLIEPGDERLTNEVYSIASCMAFGVAHLKHISGDLQGALDLLRPSSAMLRVASDRYRRGYAKMLIGAAERAIAGRDYDLLNKAINTLEEALALFSIEPSSELQHSIHRARVLHQLALAKTYKVQTTRSGSKSEHSLLLDAKSDCYKALQIINENKEKNFNDPELEYDISLTRSRIARQSAEYTDSKAYAFRALDIATTEHNFAPAYSRSKAHTAIAEACIRESDDPKCAGPDRKRLLADALSRLQVAARCLDEAKDAQGSIRANGSYLMEIVVNLYKAKIYAKTKEREKALRKLREGWVQRANGVQNAWVKQLAAEVQEEIEEPPEEFAVNLRALKNDIDTGNLEGVPNPTIWNVAVDQLKAFMIDWALQENPDNPGGLLGIEKSTISRHRGTKKPTKVAKKAAGA
jgi:hypothetical protein